MKNIKLSLLGIVITGSILCTSCITTATILAVEHAKEKKAAKGNLTTNSQTRNDKVAKKSSSTKSGSNKGVGTVSKNSGNVVLTCIGSGATREAAVKSALRMGIEQVYGAFVSSKTNIVNDNLASDEIVSVSSGNVIAYNIISEAQINNIVTVSVEAELSQSNIVKFAAAKGASVSTPIQSYSAFTMSVKLARLQASAEKKAFNMLYDKIRPIIPYCYDYTLQITEPEPNYGKYRVYLWVGVKSNDNMTKCVEMIEQTSESLAISKEEADNLKKLGEPAYGQPWEKKFYRTDALRSLYKRLDDPFKTSIMKGYTILDKYGQEVYKGRATVYPDYPNRYSYDNSTELFRKSKGKTVKGSDIKIPGPVFTNKRYTSPSIHENVLNVWHWIHCYEYELTLSQLEKFDAKFKIIPTNVLD